MKRLYDSSLGRLEVDLDIELSIWLFDDDGRVAKESGDEWEYADLADLLLDEIGLPEPEAHSIAAQFLEAAESEGHGQPPVTSPVRTSVAWTLIVGIVVALGVGVWTIATSISVEIVSVVLLLLALWLLPAILLLRWRDRRRAG